MLSAAAAPLRAALRPGALARRALSSLPATMRCVEIPTYGPPEVMVLGTRPTPAPKAGEVLLKVSATSVNRPDCVQRSGMYPAPKGASDIPGLECAGEVVSLGSGVSNLKVGDRVLALLTGGGYAEYCAAEAPTCLPIPRGLSDSEAATISETFYTVYSNIFMRAALKRGEKVLIHGGSGGIGTTAIQMAKAWGCEVFTTAEGPEKCEACLALGADHAIDYNDASVKFEDVVLEKTGKRGVDVILDIVCGSYVQRNLNCLNYDGRCVIIALMGGPKAQVSLTKMMLKRLTLTGSTLRSRDVAFKRSVAEGLVRDFWPLLESKKLRPLIHREFSVKEIVEAHRVMEANQHIGKIVVRMDF